jgi:hypothetical protein
MSRIRPSVGWSISFQKPTSARCGSATTSSRLEIGMQGTPASPSIPTHSSVVRVAMISSSSCRTLRRFFRRDCRSARIGLSARSGRPASARIASQCLSLDGQMQICPSLVACGQRSGVACRSEPTRPRAGTKLSPHRCSIIMKDTMLSNMGTSTSCPSPVASLW